MIVAARLGVKDFALLVLLKSGTSRALKAEA